MERTSAQSASPALAAGRWLAAPLLFAALVAAGGYLRVPIPGNPVPLTLQTIFVLLAGVFMAPGPAAASMAMFLAAGALGAPVFAGGGGGFAYLLGPTGGYLIGFVAAAWLCSLIHRTRRESYTRTVLAMGAASLAVHLFGALHLALYLGGDPVSAARFDFVFLPGDVLKLAAASAFAAGASSFAARRA